MGCAVVAREFHMLYVAGSNPAPATRFRFSKAFFIVFVRFSMIDVGIVVADVPQGDERRKGLKIGLKKPCKSSVFIQQFTVFQ